MSYQPLCVTAQLGSPIIIYDSLPLDGILSAAILESPVLRKRHFKEMRRFRRNVERYGRADAEKWWREHDWPIPSEHFVPLSVWGHGQGHGLWVYRSSRALYEDQARGLVYFNHHFDAELADRVVMVDKGKKIQTGKGEFKSEHIPFQYQVVEALTWYVNGELSAIEEILATVRAIAKKRNRGYGSVRRWRVEAMDVDKSVFAQDGEIMRPVPIDLLAKMGVTGDFRCAYTAYRPPYWDAQFVAICAVEGKTKIDDRMEDENESN